MMMKHLFVVSLLLVARSAAAGSDPADVYNTLRSLDAMDGALKSKHFDTYKMRHQEAARELVEEPSDDMKKSPKFGPMKDRLRALDAALVKLAGGHAAEIWADGRRTAKASADGITAAKEALDACHAAKPGDADGYKKYEAKLARAKKIDASALHWAGEDGGWHVDLPMELVLCEATLAADSSAAEDELPTALPQQKKYTDCGYTEWSFEALKIGRDRFGPFALSGVPVNNGFPMECKKLPKSAKISGELKAAALKEFKLDKGDVLAMVGGFDFDQRGLEIYKVATVRLYSKTTEITTGDCGDKDPKLVCAGSGSKTASAYDHVAHYTKRAAAHKGKEPDDCKALLVKAYKTAEEWQELYAELKKSGDWQTGLKYKTRDDGVLGEADIIARIKDLGSKADEQSRSSYCSK